MLLPKCFTFPRIFTKSIFITSAIATEVGALASREVLKTTSEFPEALLMVAPVVTGSLAVCFALAIQERISVYRDKKHHDKEQVSELARTLLEYYNESKWEKLEFLFTNTPDAIHYASAVRKACIQADHLEFLRKLDEYGVKLDSTDANLACLSNAPNCLEYLIQELGIASPDFEEEYLKFLSSAEVYSRETCRVLITSGWEPSEVFTAVSRRSDFPNSDTQHFKDFQARYERIMKNYSRLKANVEFAHRSNMFGKLQFADFTSLYESDALLKKCEVYSKAV